MATLFSYFDRWFLQIINGSTSQGFYSLSYRLSTICILFTGAMNPIFIQTVARAHAANNFIQISYIFKKMHVFYFMAAFLSIFISFNAKEIVFLIGGDKYSGAIIPLIIMMLYPIHQTYGRFCGDMLISMERTDLYRNINIISLPIGIIISYLFLAPSYYLLPGMNLGATGLALKMVIAQIIVVNIMLLFVGKILKQSFYKYLFMQVISLIPLIMIGYTITVLKDYFLSFRYNVTNILLSMFVFGCIYMILTIIFCLIFPGIVGLSRSELVKYINQSRLYFKMK